MGMEARNRALPDWFARVRTGPSATAIPTSRKLEPY